MAKKLTVKIISINNSFDVEYFKNVKKPNVLTDAKKLIGTEINVEPCQASNLYFGAGFCWNCKDFEIIKK